jgi:hypothetical protein
MGEIPDTIDKLPFTKKATPAQMILLACCSFSLIWMGVEGKGYFDASQNKILDAISQNGKKTDHNGEEINAIKQYYWKNSDQNQWAQQLDRLNRTTVPALIVPVVPPVQAVSATPE